MCNQDKVDSALFDVPLLEFVVHWAGSKKGRSRNKAEEKYSRNTIQLFRDNGCFMLNIEASPEAWPRMVPL